VTRVRNVLAFVNIFADVINTLISEITDAHVASQGVDARGPITANFGILGALVLVCALLARLVVDVSIRADADV
jgi:hypothetical protein